MSEHEKLCLGCAAGARRVWLSLCVVKFEVGLPDWIHIEIECSTCKRRSSHAHYSALATVGWAMATCCSYSTSPVLPVSAQWLRRMGTYDIESLRASLCHKTARMATCPCSTSAPDRCNAPERSPSAPRLSPAAHRLLLAVPSPPSRTKPGAFTRRWPLPNARPAAQAAPRPSAPCRPPCRRHPRPLRRRRGPSPSV